MEACPQTIDSANVLAWAAIDDGVQATGNTIHRRGGEVLNPASKLAICRYEEENSYYLFYCDENWEVITDTWHQSMDDAKSQAEFEYLGITNQWHTMS